jgi:hypothetical protein
LITFVLASICAAALGLFAGLKFTDRTGTAVALSTYALGARHARAAVWALIVWELALSASLLAGWEPGTVAAAATLIVFTLVQLAALATGRGGMPCGCMGGSGQLSAWSVLRTAVLAAATTWLATRSFAAPIAQTPVVVAGSLALAAAAFRLLVRRAPDGALDVAGEGPALGSYSALTEWLPAADGRVRLAVFTASGCRLCNSLGPALERLVEEDEVVLRTYEAEREREVWESVRVPGAPYAVAVGTTGEVLAKGTMNTEQQLRGIVADAHAAADREDVDSRRAFIGKAAVAATSVTAASAVVSLAVPQGAEAFHFCGHIYTTDSCPHPTGLPRVDSRGKPLRAQDGRQVDDLGRLIDGNGLPIDETGKPLVDPDGRQLPPAPRTNLCKTVARRFGFRTKVDGAWYRCCKGRVRKLVDCCSNNDRRINGDKALTGYCYKGRKVFCVLYYDTNVKC